MPSLTTPTATETATLRRQTVPAVASALVRDLVMGPIRRAVVVATGRSATYVDVDGELLAVVAAGGVRLPCAVVLLGDAPPPVGADLAVGAGAVRDAGRRVVEVSRWFDPRVRLTGLDPAAVAALASRVRARPNEDALLPADAAERVADHLATGDLGTDRARAIVATFLGRGTGLTPAGDDLVAGALAALRAAASPSAEALGAAVRELAPTRTTRLSATLLLAADVGAVIPDAEAVLRALAPGAGAAARAGRADGGGGLAGATERLLAIGHTSGWYLAAGLAVGAAHALATVTAGRPA
jgi:Protein of unknown function (DUF2877)